ncbi:MAG: response regulator transcription factor [Bacteroidales bacterium]|nr:response regulator transcription factor [Bacteroidales bacterium]
MTRKALIVEDHPIVSKSISDFIQSSIRNIECHPVTNGRDGLAYLNGNKPDIILLDINLPDMNGIEFCQQAKSRFPGLKILVFTSIEQRHVIEQMMQMGVQGFILKSADTEEITEAIQQVINNSTYYSKTLLISSIVMPPSQPIKFYLPVVKLKFYDSSLMDLPIRILQKNFLSVPGLWIATEKTY